MSRPQKPRKPNPIANQPENEHYIAVAYYCRRCRKFLLKFWHPTDDPDYPSRGWAYRLWLTGGQVGRRQAEDDHPVQAYDRYVGERTHEWAETWQHSGTRMTHRCGIDGRTRPIVIDHAKLRKIFVEMWAPFAHEIRRVDL
jgi:hypothetical protein